MKPAAGSSAGQGTINSTNLLPEFSIKYLSPVLGYDDYMIVALPTNMGERFPLLTLHTALLSGPSGAFPKGEPLRQTGRHNAGMAKPSSVARPEAVIS